MRISSAQRPDRPSRRPSSVHLFPGQGDFSVAALAGAVRPGTGLATAARQVFEEVDQVTAERGLPRLGPWLLGQRPPSGRELAHAGPGLAQLALYGASLTVHRALCASWGEPSAVVGVSFGEIAALASAGVLTVPDGARAAHDLALVLAGCPGGLTLLSCPEPSARRLLERAGATDTVVAVVNDDRSVVLAGPVSDLARVEKTAADQSVPAARLRLPFSSHHPELTAQSEKFAASLRAYAFAPARLPVYSAVAGRRYGPDDDLPRRLADCLTLPAVVPTVLHQVAEHRPDVAFEAGTGSALAASARRVLAADALPVHAPLTEPDFAW
ncbi:acyltransferase domain-containing protein [Streptomyces sp. SID13726]|uniref:acyltransferase domain-containing protein n=1 Tax=Streptomyces sp. SID13726 TaxID=2706058 RepID=UPI0013BB7BB4|nr:acyltransferase domain-containing protein [Streptomyces sp. SID13726]NEB00383.1 acyltransferase domain-containing protein [Streptomyces sp. SID13726]